MRENTLAAVPLLKDKTTQGYGEIKELTGAYKVVQAWGTTTSSTGASDIKIWVSSDRVHWVLAGTIKLTLDTTSDLRGGDGFAINARWKYMQAQVDTISGTGAKVSACVGC